MIVSASYRSDIPAFHGEWFLAALAAGEIAVANPYNRRASIVDLRPDAVDGYVFWTRNARPFARALDAVAAQGTPFVVQYTIIGYPRSIDANVIHPQLAVANARAIAAAYGRRVVVWRYDPILLTLETETAWHRANFARLADALAGIADEVVVSFAQLYAKSARNLARAGVTWRVPELDEQAALIAGLREQAAERGMALSLCTQPQVTAAPAARCIDAARLGDIAGRPIAAATRGNRPGCLCAESRDIGAYDSCVHGCRYCYAVGDHDAVQRRMRQDRRPIVVSGQ
jgi:CTP:molybdopterin cytidylyltransferase MocA